MADSLGSSQLVGSRQRRDESNHSLVVDVAVGEIENGWDGATILDGIRKCQTHPIFPTSLLHAPKDQRAVGSSNNVLPASANIVSRLPQSHPTARMHIGTLRRPKTVREPVSPSRPPSSAYSSPAQSSFATFSKKRESDVRRGSRTDRTSRGSPPPRVRCGLRSVPANGTLILRSRGAPPIPDRSKVRPRRRPEVVGARTGGACPHRRRHQQQKGEARATDGRAGRRRYA